MRRDAALRAIKGLAKLKKKGCILQTVIPSYPRAVEREADRISSGPGSRFKIMWVEVHKLRSRQKVLDYQTLRRYIAKTNKKRLNVVLVRGAFILWDGNHRTTAAIYLGKTRLRATVWY